VKARLVVRITPADVGRRISARTRLEAPAGSPSTTDTLGYLRSWNDGVLTVERRDGTRVTLREADLLAARVVPDPPPRRRATHA
jgi:hypothetical protein